LVQLRVLTFKVGLRGVNADEYFVDGPLREDEKKMLRAVES